MGTQIFADKHRSFIEADLVEWLNRNQFMKTTKKQIIRMDSEAVASMPHYTLPQILSRQADRLGSEKTALREKTCGVWEKYTWSDYFTYTKFAALGMVSLGLQRGRHVGVILENGPEWLFCELGIQSVGAVPFPLFSSAAADDLSEDLNRIKASFVLAQNLEQTNKLIALKAEISFIEHIIYVDPTGMSPYEDDPWLVSFSQLLELGEELDREQPDLFIKELWEGKPEDTAVVLHTSGTGGTPKAVKLSHANFTFMACSWIRNAPVGMGDNWMSINNTAWIMEQMWAIGITLCGGLVINFPESAESAMDDFREIGPDVMMGPPAFWEDLASRIRAGIRRAGALQQRFFSWANRIGLEIATWEMEDRSLSVRLRILQWLAMTLVFRPLLDRIGGSAIRVAYVGGAPVHPEMILFFQAIGLPLQQCYGMTETCGFSPIPSGKFAMMGETCHPFPETEIRLTNERELLVRSRAVFAEYLENGAATTEPLKDGWLHSGDIAQCDEKGRFLLIGRRETAIKAAGGQNISPELLETGLKLSPYIQEAVLLGEGRPYLAALINIHFENVSRWAEERNIFHTGYQTLCLEKDVEQLIREETDAFNKDLPNTHKIAKIIILSKMLEADDRVLTQTGKVKRDVVLQEYRGMIDAMYADRKEFAIRGSNRYRNGVVGPIQTTVKILDV